MSSGDLHSRLKTRKLLGVGETDDGDVHRSKVSNLNIINFVYFYSLLCSRIELVLSKRLLNDEYVHSSVRYWVTAINCTSNCLLGLAWFSSSSPASFLSALYWLVGMRMLSGKNPHKHANDHV